MAIFAVWSILTTFQYCGSGGRTSFFDKLFDNLQGETMARKKSKPRGSFDTGEYLETSGIKRKIVAYRKGQTIFSQGDASRSVLYLRAGSVKIAVTSSSGK